MHPSCFEIFSYLSTWNSFVESIISHEMHCQLCWIVASMVLLDSKNIADAIVCAYKEFSGICRSKTSYLIQRRHYSLLVGISPSDKQRVSTRARLAARCHCMTTLLRRYQLDYNAPCSGRFTKAYFSAQICFESAKAKA